MIRNMSVEENGTRKTKNQGFTQRFTDVERGDKMRKPAPREHGKLKLDRSIMDEIAKETVTKLCESYPDIDIVDLEYLFAGKFEFYMSYELLKEGKSEE